MISLSLGEGDVKLKYVENSCKKLHINRIFWENEIGFFFFLSKKKDYFIINIMYCFFLIFGIFFLLHSLIYTWTIFILIEL